MSAITIDNELVHYEVLGRGRPVILLHGWLGSWRYWVPAMQQLSMKFRTYALDFWGFGDSGKGTGRYGFEQQVSLLSLFIEELGIQKVALIGHGLGAAVAVNYAQTHPDRVPRVMAISPPLFRMAPTSVPLTANVPDKQLPAGNSQRPAGSSPAGEQPIADTEMPTMVDKPAKIRNLQTEMERMRQQAITEKSAPMKPKDAATPPSDKPAIEITTTEMKSLPQQMADAAKTAVEGNVQAANPLRDHLGTLNRGDLLKKHVDAGADFDKLKAEIDKADPEALVKSIESFAQVNTLIDIQRLSVPCVAVYGTNDTFLPPPDEPMLTQLQGSPGLFHAVKMKGNKHFPMLETAPVFARLLVDFLSTPTPELTKLEIKETWERRVR